MAEETSSDCEVLDNEIRVVLVGKTGVGKSATANLLCNENFFLSKAGSSAVTTACKHKKVKFDNKSLLVVDTPGLCDSQQFQQDTQEEIQKCIELCAPCIHAILFVVSLSNRLTQEDIDTFDNFVSSFGEKMYKYTIVIFTHPENFSNEGNKLDDYINSSPKLGAFLKKCSDRKLSIDNKASKFIYDQQRRNLLAHIKLMINENHGTGYTNRNLTETEQRIIKATLQRFENEYKEELELAKKECRKEITEKLEVEYEERIKGYEKESKGFQEETKRFNKEKLKLEEKITELEKQLKDQSVEDVRNQMSNTTRSTVCVVL